MPLIKLNSGDRFGEPVDAPEHASGEPGPAWAVRRFQDISRLVSDWIWETDQHHALTFVSQRVMESLGYHPLELKGRTLDELGDFLTKDQDALEMKWNKPFRNVLFSVLRADGEQRFQLLSGVRVYDPKTGDFIGYRGTARDITQQLLAEDKLRKSEDRYRTLFNKSPVMACSTTPEGVIVNVSDYWLEITGYSEDDVVGKPIDRFMIRQKPNDEEARSVQPDTRPVVPCKFIKKNRDTLDGLLYTSSITDDENAVVEELSVLIDVSERKKYEESLQHHANFDLLTDLPNRDLAMDRLGQAIVRSRREKLITAVMLVDIDNFKKINDILGHPAGDELLVRIGEHLRASVRDGDTVARLGGDEFLVVLPDLKTVSYCENIAQKLLDRCSRPFLINGHEVAVTVSIGVGLYPGDARDSATLLRSADAAMHRSKAKGKNTFHFFSPDIDGHAQEHLLLENQLRKALARNELVLHYQPVIKPGSNTLMGMEALVRWEHPTLGRIGPAQFIPLAEDNGMISNIGQWILRTACRETMQMREALNLDLCIAVNVSPLQFTSTRPRLIDLVRETLNDTGLPAQCLELEITESVIMSDIPENAVVLNGLHEMGVRLAIDDFGTGYSSLSYLKKFPFDTLKIDRMFVRDINHDPQDNALASAIVAMAHALDLKVVGEGVETPVQLEYLSRMDCDFIQGFHYSKPLDKESFVSFARRTTTAEE
ncbi:MAG: EAL domain-containing protein [Alphaproteobacteria bacterium]